MRENITKEAEEGTDVKILTVHPLVCDDSLTRLASNDDINVKLPSLGRLAISVLRQYL